MGSGAALLPSVPGLNQIPCWHIMILPRHTVPPQAGTSTKDGDQLVRATEKVQWRQVPVCGTDYRRVCFTYLFIWFELDWQPGHGSKTLLKVAFVAIGADKDDLEVVRIRPVFLLVVPLHQKPREAFAWCTPMCGEVESWNSNVIVAGLYFIKQDQGLDSNPN